MTKRQEKWRRHGARYKARRRAVDVLFEAEARDIDPMRIVEDRTELARVPENQVAPIAQYTRQIVLGAAEELDALDSVIVRFLSDQWELGRLPAVDRAILRMSVWELIFNPDVPTATAVVEGVEIASEYSGEQGAPYIHAVLDDVAENLDEVRASVRDDAAADTAAETAEDPDATPEPPTEDVETIGGTEGTANGAQEAE
ncbi:transcription antitermination factor NusB [Corynebacterium sp. 21KM1197]|uniref:transcription antitermination factor NusB n=1 Tax=Corynebacterium sp. 21KM1197 TaxID=2989734 RepID=UPI0029CA7DE5|nr:transcription antitermination factor NusB [Corynebacterium sp. 21KM1197]WPF67658.1 transcription antitermination factor NusB [Corynebacterium sp. 21KM1197]